MNCYLLIFNIFYYHSFYCLIQNQTIVKKRFLLMFFASISPKNFFFLFELTPHLSSLSHHCRLHNHHFITRIPPHCYHHLATTTIIPASSLSPPQLVIVRQKDKLEALVQVLMAEDKTSSKNHSYVDYLCHLHKEIRNSLI